MRREYGRSRYHSMSEEKKQRLKEYQKNIVRLKNIFHRCNKDAFQNCCRKDIFYLFFY